MRTFAGRDRTAIVLYLVLGVMATVASILFLLHASFMTWGQRLHVDTDEVIARHLAHGAMEAALFAAEKQLDVRDGPAAVDLHRGKLAEVLMGDEAALKEVFGSGAAAADAEQLLRQLLGPEPFQQAAELAKPFEGATLKWSTAIGVDVAPVNGLVDLVAKTVTWDLTCACQFRHARRQRKASLRIAVGSHLPGVLGRFTLAMRSAAAGANTLRVDREGGALGATKPVICFNDPDDYHPADPIWGTSSPPGNTNLAPTKFTRITELEKIAARRGAVYLDSGDPANPLVLQIAAGGAPAGQNFQFMVRTGKDPEIIEAQPLATQPPAVASMRPTQPGTTVRQNVWIEGLVTGFYSGVNSRGQLGSDGLFATVGDGSSLVRPLGTASHPSLGLVYGAVRSRLAAVSNVAVDRDEGPRDEQQQTADTGAVLPIAEVRQQPLKRVTAASFAQELAREASGAPLQDLLFFGNESLGPGLAFNENSSYQPEGGQRVDVPCEQPFQWISLLRLFYRYGRMFPAYAEYERAMSRPLDFSYNSLLRYANLKPDAAQLLLMAKAFAPVAAPDDQDMLVHARWEHTDPVHQELADPTFVDSRRAKPADGSLSTLVAEASAVPRAIRHGITCYGEKLFRDSFLEGESLDLGGNWVSLAAKDPTTAPPPLVLGRVSVAPRGGGVLDVRDLTLSGLRNTGVEESFEPLVVRVGTLRLRGLGPFEGTFIVDGQVIVEPSTEKHTVIRGNLILGPGASLNLGQPLALVYDRALDPTGPGAHRHYRSRLLSVWDRRRAGPSAGLIGINPYRRDEP